MNDDFIFLFSFVVAVVVAGSRCIFARQSCPVCLKSAATAAVAAVNWETKRNKNVKQKQQEKQRLEKKKKKKKKKTRRRRSEVKNTELVTKIKLHTHS